MADTESVTTQDTETQPDTDPLSELSDERLYQLVEDTLQSNDVLQTETEMFEKFLKRVEPKDGGHSSLASTSTPVTATPSASMQDLRTVGGRRRSKSKSGTIERLLKLSAEQKCDIAQRELEELREDIDKFKEESEKVLDNHKAHIEEADTRLSEIRKSSYEFERDILKGGVNPRTGKVVGERATRYFEDRIRAKDTLIEKLRLKNSSLKVQKRKLQLQLKQKEEMGEVLHEVDFQQLKIENAQYLERIDERNQDLLRLKLMAGNTMQVLNSYKKKLNTLTAESERLKSEISSRQDMLTRIDAETNSVEEERSKAEKENKKYRTQLADYRVPDVLDYVQDKADLYELQKTVKSWERKVEIAEMALKTHKKTWYQMQMASQHISPWKQPLEAQYQ
ncbi:cilia- and flagella-associated protein 263-like [Branchiostoma floridae x Branchiostoma belcheri]